MTVNDAVRVKATKDVGFVSWFGITRRGNFAVCVNVGGQKRWFEDVSLIENADGTPVVVDAANAPVSNAAWRMQQAQAPHTRKRTVPEVRAMEARVAELESEVAELKVAVATCMAALAGRGGRKVA